MMAICQRAGLPPKGHLLIFIQNNRMYYMLAIHKEISPKKGTHPSGPRSCSFKGSWQLLLSELHVHCIFRCQNMVPAVLIEGYTRINEKIPCSHPINKYLINGMGRPEAVFLQIPIVPFHTGCEPLWLTGTWRRAEKQLIWWLALGWMRAGEEHSEVFHGLPSSCHQVWVLKRCCHFIQRDLLGWRENLNAKFAV